MMRRSMLSTACVLMGLWACDDGVPAGPGFEGSHGSADGDRGVPLSCEEVRGPLRRLVRLTPTEYQNTVRDVLQVEGDWASTFPADPVVRGFDRAADQLLVTPLLADKLQAAAEDIAARADLTRFAPCMASANASCLQTLAHALGAKLFRRPTEQAEIEPYLRLAEAAPAPLQGAQRILAAMLQSPRFLYRTELGRLDEDSGLYVLEDYEVASELSYLLWQSAPDQALLDAAERKALHGEQDIADAVERMLKDERSRPVLRAFIEEWLGLSAVTTVPKDTATFPELSAEIRGALQEEVDRFVDHVLSSEGGSVTALLTSPTTFLNPTLAAFYGLADAESVKEGEALELGEQGRRGILTLGATMLVHARSNDSSPIHRGRLIRERLLCEELPPPPAGIVIEPPALDPEKTSRERYRAHSEQEPCASCHRLMDPIGFAFEHFDGIGRYRADDHGRDIDDSAQILVSSDVQGDFPKLDAMIDALAQSEQVRGCYASSLVRFAHGFGDDERGECLSKRAAQAFGSTDGTLTSLIGVLTHPELLLKRERGSSEQDGEDEADDEQDQDDEEPAPNEDASTPQPEEGYELKQTVNNDWGAGYCHTYEVINRSDAPLTWSVSRDLGGTLNQNWESKTSGSSGTVQFTGAEHNAVLAPGASTQFGFCVTR